MDGLLTRFTTSVLFLYFTAWYQPVHPQMYYSSRSTELQSIGFFASSNPAVAGKRVSFICNVKQYNSSEDKVNMIFLRSKNNQSTTIVSGSIISKTINDTYKYTLYREEDMFILTIHVDSSSRDAGLYMCCPEQERKSSGEFGCLWRSFAPWLFCTKQYQLHQWWQPRNSTLFWAKWKYEKLHMWNKE